MEELFAPPAENWRSLAPAYLRLRRLSVVLNYGLPTVALVLLFGWLWSWWAALAVGTAGICVLIIRLLRQPALVRSWGYTERDTDLCIKHGLWFRSMVIVPYGRMQAVEIEAGPIAQHFGVTTVTLVTASASSNARIPGLNPQVAEHLRDRMLAMAERKDAGL